MNELGVYKLLTGTVYTQNNHADIENTALTNLCQLHQLLRRRYDTLWFDFTDETVGDVGVSIIEQLADDELVQVLPVFQSWFGTKHVGSV